MTTNNTDCPVITSRKVYEECQLRVTNLDDTMAGLESDELICRKAIDKLLTSDDTVAFQMKSEQLVAIKSKQVHIRQSKGVAYKALLDALDNYNDDLAARTRSRKVKLYAQLNAEQPDLLEALRITAEAYMTNFSIVNGLPIRTIDLNKILRKQDGFNESIQARINEIEYNIEAD